MAVTTQAEFDAIMNDPLTTIDTTIELPGGSINWQLNIIKPCTIFGNNTTVDLSSLGIDYAIIITAADIDISDITAINSERTAIYMESVNGGKFENINAGHSNYGWLIKDCMNNEFNECSSYNNNINIEMVGSSSILGNIDSYQEFGLSGLIGENSSGLLANSDYYFKINDKEYKLSTDEYITINNLIQQINNAKRTTDGQVVKADFLATLTNGDIRITSLTNATVALSRSETNKDLFKYILGFDTREITTITCNADIDFSLQSKYWLLNTFSNNYYIWYSVGNGGINPSIANKTEIKIDIDRNEIAEDVALKTKTELDKIADENELIIEIDLNIITITCQQSGNCENTIDGNTGFDFNNIEGSNDGVFETAQGSTKEEDRTDRCHHNTWNNSTCHDGSIGIKLTNANHNEFSGCKTYENTNIGIWQTDISYNNIYNGEIFGNIKYGVKNTDRNHNFDVTSTWWGDMTGPSGSGKGEGDKISNYVLFDPWLQSGTEPELTYIDTRNWIWHMLGYPQVAVEMNEEQITECIEMALEKFNYYWQPEPYYTYLSIGEGQYEIELPVDIPKESVIEVVYSPLSDIFAQLSGSGESFFLTYYMQHSGGAFLTDFYIAMSYKETFERTLGLVPSYEFLTHPDADGIMKDYLRLYPRPSGGCGLRVGLKVSRQLTQLEVDQQAWIRKYALAWAKQMLGQIRSKFSSVPGPTGEISLKGDTLIQEGKDEQDKLEMDIIKRSEPLGFTTG